jgi:transcriptional regulator with XRE-family HTH domain
MVGIGERISTIRKDANKQQGEFAEVMGVSRQTVSNWETEKKLPALEYIIKIAVYGKVSLDWLITGVDSKKELYEEIKSKDMFIKELLKKYGELSVQSEKDIIVDARQFVDKKK